MTGPFTACAIAFFAGFLAARSSILNAVFRRPENRKIEMALRSHDLHGCNLRFPAFPARIVRYAARTHTPNDLDYPGSWPNCVRCRLLAILASRTNRAKLASRLSCMFCHYRLKPRPLAVDAF